VNGKTGEVRTVLDFQVIFAPGVLVGAPLFSASSLLLLVVGQFFFKKQNWNIRSAEWQKNTG